MGGLWPSNERWPRPQPADHLGALATPPGDGYHDARAGMTTRRACALRLPHCDRVISIPYACPSRAARDSRPPSRDRGCRRYPVDLWKWRVAQVRRAGATRSSRTRVDRSLRRRFSLRRRERAARRPGAGRALRAQRRVPDLEAAQRDRPQAAAGAARSSRVEWRKLRRAKPPPALGADLTIAVSEEDRHRLHELAPDCPHRADPDGRRYRVLRAGRRRATARKPRLHRLDGLASERRRHAAFHRTRSSRCVRREVPDVSLAIVGRNPTVRLSAAAERAGIIVTGTVDDVRPYVSGSGGLRRAAPRGRRHAAEDFRSARDGESRSFRRRSAPRGSR